MFTLSTCFVYANPNIYLDNYRTTYEVREKMNAHVAHELNDADEQILDELHSGRNLPQNLSERLGYSRQYIQNRLQMLKAADYVDNLGGGLYQLRHDPRESNGDSDADDDVGEQRELKRSIEALKADRDGLQQQIDQRNEIIERLQDNARQARIHLDRALADLPDDAPGRMAVEDGRAELDEWDD